MNTGSNDSSIGRKIISICILMTTAVIIVGLAFLQVLSLKDAHSASDWILGCIAYAMEIVMAGVVYSLGLIRFINVRRIIAALEHESRSTNTSS